jgi:hypothetical protein
MILAYASPAVKAFLDSVSDEAAIGPLKGLKALYVLIPLIIGLVSRILRLHDKISDILRIRFLFDTGYILFPLAKLSGHTLTKELRKEISRNRNDGMYAVFYPYAGFKDPIIGTQLVQTAADNWGWFWVLLESFFMFAITAIILLVSNKTTYAQTCLAVLAVQMCLLIVEWFACRRSAKRQIDAILADNSRRISIHTYFAKIRIPNQGIQAKP